ncbi:MAG: PHP domain-containing protein [Bacillota bacterium]
MKFTGDYHTHSTYSDGRASIADMARAARSKGMKEMAVTDHGPSNIGVGIASPKKLLEIVQKVQDFNEELDDFKVLSGVEANIVGSQGEIDIPADIYKGLDVLIIGLHPYVWPISLKDGWNLVLKNQVNKYLKAGAQSVVNSNTKTLKEACFKHRPFCISHPGLGLPVDVAEIAAACAKTGAAYEINCGHLFQTVPELQEAAKQGPEFIINSDSHFTHSVGELQRGFELAQKAGIEMDRIRNVIH